MSTTEILQLTKPDLSDNYDLSVWNENLDKIETFAKNSNLKKKHYNTLSALISDNSQEEGNLVTTLGYNTLGDGGHCDYYISDSDMSKNTEYSIATQLNNGLYANPILSSPVNIRIFGATQYYSDSSPDTTPIITKILRNGYQVFIPKGIWSCSPLTLAEGDVIVSENTNYQLLNNVRKNQSILLARSDCDVFVDCSNVKGLNLQVALASCTWQGAYASAKNVGTFLKLSNTQYSTFDVFIFGVSQTGVSISSSWENTFKRLYFRLPLKPNTVNILADVSATGNISQNVFWDIQSEGFGSTLLKTVKDSSFGHNKIYSWLHENSVYNPFQKTDVSTEVDNYIPLFILNGGGDNIIGSLQLNNFALSNASYNSVNYGASFIQVDSGSSDTGYTFDDVIFDYGLIENKNYNIPFFKKVHSGSTNEISMAYININNLEVSQRNIGLKIDIDLFPQFRIGNIRGKNSEYSLPSISEWFSPDYSDHAYLVSKDTNKNILNREQCSVRIPPSDLWTEVKLGNIHIHKNKTLKAILKSVGATTVVAHLVLKKLDGTTTNQSVTLNVTDGVATYDIYTATDDVVVTVRMKTAGEAYIYDLFTE